MNMQARHARSLTITWKADAPVKPQNNSASSTPHGTPISCIPGPTGPTMQENNRPATSNS